MHDEYIRNRKLIPKKLANVFHQENNFIFLNEETFFYSQGVYKKISDEKFEQKLEAYLPDRFCTIKNYSEVRNLLLRTSANITYQELNHKKI